MTNNIVSVVLPYRDRKDTLRQSVESVLSSTYDRIQLILVDDGSIDGSSSIAQEFDDERIVHVRHDAPRGVCLARNSGIQRAEGRYIAFQDSDDVWQPGKLDRQLEYLQNARDDIVAVGCDWSLAGKARPKPTDRTIVAWGRAEVLAGCAWGLGTPMLVIDRHRAVALEFDNKFPALVERDFLLGCMGTDGIVVSLPDNLVTVRRGRSDHVANAERAYAAVQLYLSKYQTELSDSRLAEAWYHDQALRYALLLHRPSLVRYHNRQLKRLLNTKY